MTTDRAFSLSLALPDWALPLEDATRRFADDGDKMRFVIDLARRNVEMASGGPFGAALFARDTGRLVSIGVNSVLRLRSSVLHAEMLALMRAQRALASHTLHRQGATDYELFSSCEPCAMCLGAILWSGVRRLVCAGTAECARAIGFDEGPVDAGSYHHLQQAGIEVRLGLLSEAADAVIRRYRDLGGSIYNA
jgi:tRNA(Arg) A34 adenosine deaminase TadA